MVEHGHFRVACGIWWDNYIAIVILRVLNSIQKDTEVE